MKTMSWTDEKLEALEANVDDGFTHANVEFARIDERFKRVDERFDDVDRRFEDVDRRFEDVDRRFDEVDRRFDDVDKRFDRMEDKFDAFMRLTVQVGWGLVGTLVLALVTMFVAVFATL